MEDRYDEYPMNVTEIREFVTASIASKGIAAHGLVMSVYPEIQVKIKTSQFINIYYFLLLFVLFS